MLEQQKMKWLMQELAATAEMLDKPISPPVVMMLATDLEDYPREVLAVALKRVRTEGAGKLTSKAIIEAIDRSALAGLPGCRLEILHA